MKAMQGVLTNKYGDSILCDYLICIRRDYDFEIIREEFLN